MVKKKIDKKVWAIYSLTPCPEGDQWRYVENFEVHEDGMDVFNALQKVNIMFNCYKLCYVSPMSLKTLIIKRGVIPK